MKRKSRESVRESGNFMSGVLVLSLSTVIVKIIGLAYKIPMIAYLGAEGMGYFNSAYEIYAMLCVISTAGLPVALSMLISASRERGAWGETRRIYHSALSIFLILGSCGTVLMLVFSKPLSVMIGNESAFLCLLAIAPALFCVCFSSAVRGYFQGFHRMAPTAISQLIEALGKLIFGIWFALLALRRGLSIPAVAACAVLGLSLGTFLSALYLLLIKATEKKGKRPDEPLGKRKYAISLLRIAIPITLSSAVLSVTKLADMALIMRRLQETGLSAAEANVIYGSYTTLAVPVFSLIPSLITPISLVSVPQLSAAIEKASKYDQITVTDRSIRLTVLLSMPAALGISVYAKPILSFLFASETDAVTLAAPLLSILGTSILFAGLITTTNAILQSYRQTVKPILSMATGAIVKILCAYLLIGIPSIGVYGAPISTFFCNLTVTGMNFVFLGRCLPKNQKGDGFFGVYWKPLFASVLAILASWAIYLPIVYRLEAKFTALMAAIAVAFFVYVAMLLLVGGITEEDIALLPMGTRILAFFKKYKRKMKIKDGTLK